MKIQILDTKGKKIKDIQTDIFSEPIREDLIYKVVESERMKHPYAPKFEAGMDISASGIQRKTRHSWKSDRGRGLSRIPRKISWRRGTQFSWIGAVIPSARGGRRAHPPKKDVNLKKINKKELKKALFSSLAYVTEIKELQKKYSSIKDKKTDLKLPIVIEDKILALKSKEFFITLKKVLGELYDISVQKKSVRAGRGKLRGRKNKKTRGLLFIIGNEENYKIKGIDILKVSELNVSDLVQNGARITMFSEKAIKDLERVKEGKVKNETTNN